MADFRAGVKQNPHNAVVELLLAEALSQEPTPEESPEYKEEIDAATLAIKLDPNSLRAHGLLAAIYLRYGEIDLAIHQCRAALQSDPDDQQTPYHLILVLRKTNKKDEVSQLGEADDRG